MCVFFFFFLLYVFGICSHLLFLFLGHVWCSGATTEDQGFSSCRQSAGLFHAQCHCHWVGTYVYLDNVETNVRWNHQTASFHCSTPKTLRAVRTFSVRHRETVANRHERFEVCWITQRLSAGSVNQPLQPGLLLASHRPSSWNIQVPFQSNTPHRMHIFGKRK